MYQITCMSSNNNPISDILCSHTLRKTYQFFFLAKCSLKKDFSFYLSACERTLYSGRNPRGTARPSLPQFRYTPSEAEKKDLAALEKALTNQSKRAVPSTNPEQNQNQA